MAVLPYIIMLLFFVLLLTGVCIPLLRRLIDRALAPKITELISLDQSVIEKEIKNV